MSDDPAQRFSEVYGALYGRVRAYAARRVGADAADEVAAETFTIARRRFEAMPAEPLPWLYGVARNVVARHRAGTARQAATRDALEREPTSEFEPTGTEDEAVWEASHQLREADREVLALIAWEALSVAEASRVLGRPAPAATARPAAGHRARRRASRRGRGAVAATDPFGLFRDPNPGSALFGVDPGRHVKPPTEQSVACPSAAGATFTCGSGLGGQRYLLTDNVSSPGPRLTRGYMLAALRREVRQGQLSPQGGKRLQDDIAAVSDQFIARFSEMMRFGTYSTSLTATGSHARVPPAGVPSLLVCESAGTALRCRDMNGDDSAAVGSGIYVALPAPDWRPAQPRQPDSGWDLEVAILGHPPTAAELRFEVDLVRYGTTSSGASEAQPRRASSPPAH